MRNILFLLLAFVFFGVWIVSWAAFHIAGGFIHILLVIAVISLVVHFFSGRGTA